MERVAARAASRDYIRARSRSRGVCPCAPVAFGRTIEVSAILVSSLTSLGIDVEVCAPDAHDGDIDRLDPHS